MLMHVVPTATSPGLAPLSSSMYVEGLLFYLSSTSPVSPRICTGCMINSSLLCWCYVMENELNLRLARLQLQEYPAITAHTQNDCLFLAAIDRIKDFAYGERTKNKSLVPAGQGNVDSVVTDHNEREVKCRISDVQGLRNFVALAALQLALKPNAKRMQLMSHIKHRFVGGMREADLALADVQPLPHEPSEVELVHKWAQVICKGGT
jgi:hypothetical protein